jgi:hypothetical protein
MSTAPVMISAEDRDLVYHRILIHLSGIDAVWLAARHRDFASADRLGQEFCDELHLVMDDLGWGDNRGDAPIELTSPPEVVRRVFGRLRHVAAAENLGEGKSRELQREAEEENRRVREICDEILAGLDGSSAGVEARDA